MNNNVFFSRWLRLSFINLFLVAFLGVILRYKIVYPLPIIDQKFLLHGHSHFAFAGWLTQILMVLLVRQLSDTRGAEVYRQYRWMLYGNCITAYGMLISFPIQGYAFASILFSTLSIINSYFFVVRYWRDCSRSPIKQVSHKWFKAALLFLAISSLGAFSLAYMMATKTIAQRSYLGSIYFFLHFQYNGWFFFAIMGLLTTRLEAIGISAKKLKWAFWLFAGACIPAYFLSALWMPIPLIVYLLVIISAVAQVAGWVILVRELISYKFFQKLNINGTAKWLLILSFVALSVKLLLQLGSTYPSLSNIAFGFRPIVIGYLHLVLLGVISIFLIGYVISISKPLSKIQLSGIWVFVSGVVFNEILLMLQGVTAMNYVALPHINELLLIAAIIMCSGIFIWNLKTLKL